MSELAKRNQAIRHEVLLQLYGSGQSLPISIELILRVCRRTGFDYGETELREALHFLAGQGLAEPKVDQATGVQRWVITSQGVLHYENHE